MKWNNLKQIVVCLLSIVLFVTVSLPVFSIEPQGEELTGAALLKHYGLTPHGYAGGTDVVKNATIDAEGRLVITAGGSVGNLFVGVPVDALGKTLEEYTVEAQLSGIGLNDGWHYGIGWNNSQNNSNENWFTMRTGVYTSGKNNGELRCYVQKIGGAAQGSSAYKMGDPSSPFAGMSAANNTTNTFKATVKKVDNGSNITFYINDTQIISITDTVNAYTLLDFNIIIPYTTTVAISQIRVLDETNAIVYHQDFVNASNEEHTVTVNYVYEDGGVAAESVSKAFSENAFYSINSPEIDGFTPTFKIVSGVMKNENVTVTVVYRASKTVTIHYVRSDGMQLFKDVVIDNLMPGDRYCVESIPVANYTCDRMVVEGVVSDSNVELSVTYTPVKYTLTIKYVFEDGTVAYQDYVGSHSYHMSYRVESPSIDGYTPDQQVIESDRMGKDTVLTVTYAKNKTVNENVDTNEDATTEKRADETHTADASQSATGGCANSMGIAAILPIVSVMGLGVAFSRKRKF